MDRAHQDRGLAAQHLH